MFHREKSNHESVLLMQQQFELDMPIEWRKEASTGHARESEARFWFLETDQLRTYVIYHALPRAYDRFLSTFR